MSQKIKQLLEANEIYQEAVALSESIEQLQEVYNRIADGFLKPGSLKVLGEEQAAAEGYPRMDVHPWQLDGIFSVIQGMGHHKKPETDKQGAEFGIDETEALLALGGIIAYRKQRLLNLTDSLQKKGLKLKLK